MFDDCLFKYRTLDKYSKRILTHNEIYFTCPFDFNDPFDCQLPVSWEASEDFLRQQITNLMGQLPSDPDRPSDKWIEDMVIDENIHSDPIKMKGISRNGIESSLKNIGVFCLTAKNDDILLWSHYANGHRGFCLAFERNFYRKNPIEVDYQEQYPHIPFTGENRDWATILVKTKSKRWCYEKEWRILDTNPGRKEFDETKLLGIILGCRMNPKDKKRILKLINRRKHKPTIFEAHRNDNKYSLDIRQLV